LDAQIVKGLTLLADQRSKFLEPMHELPHKLGLTYLSGEHFFFADSFDYIDLWFHRRSIDFTPATRAPFSDNHFYSSGHVAVTPAIAS